MDIKKVVLPFIAASSIIIGGAYAPVTDRLIAFVQSYEGYSSVPYADPGQPTNKKLITVCSGITNLALPGFVIEGKTYTKDECCLAEEQILNSVSINISYSMKQSVTQEQYEMLIDFVYNVGINNFKKSTLLKKINANDCFGAAKEFYKWNKANGKTMKGLTRRRDAEEANFVKHCLPNGTFPTKGVILEDKYGN